MNVPPILASAPPSSMSTFPLPPRWIMDACCAINFAASGHFAAMLRAPVDRQVLTVTVADIAVAEAASLRRGGNGDDAEERDPLDWPTFFASGCVRRESEATGVEVALFVSLAALVDDGEAMALALAASRGCGVLTDDRKARRVAEQLAQAGQPVPILDTPAIVSNWSQSVDERTLGAALRAIREKASYVPPRAHPLQEWWLKSLEAS